MKDLKDRTDELLAGWAEAGICITCFRNIKGDVVGQPQPHADWCEEEGDHS